MSATSPVDFRNVVDAFNQSGWPQKNCGKLKRNSANFDGVTVQLECNPKSNDLDAKNYSGQTRTVRQYADSDVKTEVSVDPSATPGSTIAIVTGYVQGIASQKMKAEMKTFLDNHILLNLTEQEQHVKISEAVKTKIPLPPKGQVDFRCESTVYQGSFEGVAKVSGDVQFTIENGHGTTLIPIQLMAEKAKLPKPFYYANDALCWHVSGSYDFLVDHVTLVNK